MRNARIATTSHRAMSINETRCSRSKSRGRRTLSMKSTPVLHRFIDERIDVGSFGAEVHDACANGEAPVDHGVRWKHAAAELQLRHEALVEHVDVRFRVSIAAKLGR